MAPKSPRDAASLEAGPRASKGGLRTGADRRTVAAVPALDDGYLTCLGDKLVLRLAGVSPSVRRAVEYLVSRNAMARLLGLDATFEVLAPGGDLDAADPDALPFVFALATSPHYPHAASLLVRLEHLLELIHPSALGDSVATRATAHAAPQLRAAYETHVPALLHLARRSRDPEAARIAARIASYFRVADDELAPILVALLSGTADAGERMRIFVALARVEVPSARFHPRLLRALRPDAPLEETTAAAVGLARAQRHGVAIPREVHHALDRVSSSADRARVLPNPWGPGERPLHELASEALRQLGRG